MKRKAGSRMKRLLGVMLALAMLMTLMPLSLMTVYADGSLSGPYDVASSASLDGTNTSRNLTFDKAGNGYVVYRDTSDNSIKIKKSTDGGKTWGDPVAVAAEGKEPEVAAASNGNVYVSYCVSSTESTYVAYSTDGAASFVSTKIELQGQDYCRSMHIACDNDYVYGVNPIGDYCYVSSDGGKTFTANRTTAAGEGYSFTDIKVDETTGAITVIKDNPSVVYYTSEDHGATFSEQKIPTVNDEQAQVFYSTAAYGSPYVYIAGYRGYLYRINPATNEVKAISIPAIKSGSAYYYARSLAADASGNLMVGYVNENGKVAFVVSHDYGETFDNEVEVAEASAANVAIDPKTGNLAFLYTDNDGNAKIVVASGYISYDTGVKTTRVAGDTRYGTALKVADELMQQKGGKFDKVVLATGENFPDALTGSSFAASIDAPVLLVDKTCSSANTQAVLASIPTYADAGSTVYLLGGTSVIDNDTEAALTASGYNVKRLAGADRYETNLAIIEEMNAV